MLGREGSVESLSKTHDDPGFYKGVNNKKQDSSNSLTVDLTFAAS